MVKYKISRPAKINIPKINASKLMIEIFTPLETDQTVSEDGEIFEYSLKVLHSDAEHGPKTDFLVFNFKQLTGREDSFELRYEFDVMLTPASFSYTDFNNMFYLFKSEFEWNIEKYTVGELVNTKVLKEVFDSIYQKEIKTIIKE